MGFKRFVEPLARRIAGATNESTPLTIGVYGEWGSGKTSFMQMVDEELKKKGIHPIWFNAWKYDKEDNLWSALIQTILDQIRVSGKWYRRLWVKLAIWRHNIDLRAGTLEIVKRVVPTILRILLVALSILIVFGWGSSEVEAFLNQMTQQWFSSHPLALTFFQLNVAKAIVAIIGFLATKPSELFKLFDARLGIDFSKFSHTPSYRAHIAFLDEFSEELRQIIRLAGGGRPVVVIIDDLDRCLPEKAIQVLEAIKLFLDVEGCIFILAVDRNVLEKAVAVKYKELLAMAKETGSQQRELAGFLGENYFEKIVQLPIPLPPLSETQIKDFVVDLYPGDDDVQLCSSVFALGLPCNPRKVKRLLQAFAFYRDLLFDDIDNGQLKPRHLAILVIIQSQFRQLYQDIAATPVLLAEIEKYYRRQIALPDEGEAFEEVADPVLREQVEASATQYPLLRKVLLQIVAEGETFVGIDLDRYIFLFQPVATSEPSEIPTGDVAALALGRYLRQVLAITELVNVRGIPSTRLVSLSIESVFVPRLLTIVPADTPQGAKQVTLPEVMQMTARSVVLGDPGSGKTTLLSYLAYICASALSRDDPSLVQSRLGLSTSPLPLLIPLREYGRYVEQQGTVSATPLGFLEFIDHYFQRWDLGLSPGFFVEYFERGNCLLLLDGLDEIVQPATRHFVAQSIVALAKRYPAVRVIVASRVVGYQAVPLGEDFAPYILTDFDEEDIAEFVQRWLSQTMDRASAEQEAAALSEAISARPELKRLASNPLLLTVIANLHLYTLKLPVSRLELYENALKVLLEQWDAARGIEPVGPSLYEKRHLLASLAFAIHEGYPSGLVDKSFVISVFSKELAERGLSQADAFHQAESLLTSFAERSGVLIERGPSIYGFVHLTFEEYLAAIALTEHSDLAEFILSHYENSRWREVIILTVAYIGLTVPDRSARLISALVETRGLEGVLLAGECLLQIKTLKVSAELRE
ncbi:MAG: hypothetical protein DRJ03_29190, partial [Chloroflexi bacterium]